MPESYSSIKRFATFTVSCCLARVPLSGRVKVQKTIHKQAEKFHSRTFGVSSRGKNNVARAINRARLGSKIRD